MSSTLYKDWQSTTNTIVERNSHMFNNPLMSDIKLTCGNSGYFHTHKYVLATSSPVFYAMFYGELAEKDAIVHLPDVDEEALREFLRFLYTEQCTLTPETAVPVMYLGKKYIVPSLVKKCVAVVRDCMNPDNILPILEQMILFDEKQMERKCWEVIGRDTLVVVTSKNFADLSYKTLTRLLKRHETLNIAPIELFHAVLVWTEHQCWRLGLEASNENKRAVIGDAIFQLQFLSMTSSDLLQYISTSGLLTGDEFVSLWQQFIAHTELPAQSQQPCLVLSDLHQITRFPRSRIKPPTSAWSYGNRPDRIAFSASRPGVLHGIRLFGDDDGSKYEVSLEVSGTCVKGTYLSELDDQGVYGFDVMLDPPVNVTRDTLVTAEVQIQGPNSYYGNDGEELVDIGGITVVFRDAPGYSNGTSVKQGQFQYIIMSF